MYRNLLFLLGLTYSTLCVGERWTHYGLRPLAMGNAYVAVADDFNAIFYNPAGLTRLKSWDGELLNPAITISSNTRDFLDDAMNLSGGEGGDTAQVLDLIEGQTGKNQYLSLGLTPHLVFPFGFGIGIGLNVVSEMIFHRYPTVDIDVGPRVVLPISYALELIDEKLSIGFSLKLRMRGGINHAFSLQDIQALSKKQEDESQKAEIKDFVEGGMGYGSDFGFLFTPVKAMKPTIGLSVTDIGGTPYSKMNISGKALGKPDPVLPSVNMGFSILPYETKRTFLRTSVDVHMINQPTSFSKKLNAGMEFGLGSIFKTQLGLYQGYMSGGMELDVGLLNLRIMTYAEELGETAGQIADRRYAFQMKLLI